MEDESHWVFYCGCLNSSQVSPFTGSPSSNKLSERYLPEGYRYCVCAYADGHDDHFSCTLRLPISTEEGAHKWLREFQEKSLTTMRVENTYPQLGERIVFKKRYRCQHKTRAKVTSTQKQSSKNTLCPASLTIVVKKTWKHSKSKDVHLKEFPMKVTLDFAHNHPLNYTDSLRHRDVSDSTTQKFKQLYEVGHSPASALEMRKYELQCEHGDHYAFVAADRSFVPDLQWCYRLYYKTFHEAYGAKGRDKLIADLEASIKKQNEGKQHTEIKMKVTENNQLVVAIFTPLMRRVSSSLTHSKEMVFMDSTGHMDRRDCRVFMLMTHTCAGGLPVGCLITTSETSQTIQEALELYKSLLSDGSFNGRGTRGPHVFMTDDSKAECHALSVAFPEAVPVVCAFHVLRALWRWLWDAKNSIRKDDRQHLFSLMKSMLYAATNYDLIKYHAEAVNDATAVKYPNFSKHLGDIFDKRNAWAVCLRSDLPISGNNTNNLWEAAVGVLKDKMLPRTKAFNLRQLVDFIMTSFEGYYQRKVVDIANNRLDIVKMSRFMPQESNIPHEHVLRLSETNFLVPSESKQGDSYTVNMEMGMCTCPVGFTGAPCKHQAVVLKKYNLSSLNFLRIYSAQDRAKLYFIGTGERKHSPEDSSESNEFGRRQAGGQSNESESNPNAALIRDFGVAMDELRAKVIHQLKAGDASVSSGAKSFVRNIRAIESHTHLVSALTMFGKCSDVTTGRVGRNRSAGVESIRVRPTAAARRKRPAADGTKSDQRGRPPKGARTSEHGYSKSSPQINAAPCSTRSSARNKTTCTTQYQ